MQPEQTGHEELERFTVAVDSLVFACMAATERLAEAVLRVKLNPLDNQLMMIVLTEIKLSSSLHRALARAIEELRAVG